VIRVTDPERRDADKDTASGGGAYDGLTERSSNVTWRERRSRLQRRRR